MNVFGNSSKQLLQALTANAERETMDYVLQEMQAVLGEEMPEADAVRTYLQDPDRPTELSTTQQIIAMDKLLEYAGNFTGDAYKKAVRVIRKSGTRRNSSRQ